MKLGEGEFSGTPGAPPRSGKAIIIGAGPAGLTAADELQSRSNIKPIILEADPIYVGGISKTVRAGGNRIDIGGHRFFSKSDRAMNWWLARFPIEEHGAKTLNYRGKHRELPETPGPDPRLTDEVMLVRPRKSRIYYRGTFFDYPIRLSVQTLAGLGIIKSIRICLSYLFRKILPRRPEKNLEDFYRNRFGNELYETFFQSYTEKVWGVPCKEISADWGRQRVRGLSLKEVLKDAIAKPFRVLGAFQRDPETSLITWFLYPKHGPGAIWEHVAEQIVKRGGELHMGERVVDILAEDDRIVTVTSETRQGLRTTYEADHVFSTMPIKDLVRALGRTNDPVGDISENLQYRDFITVGLLLRKAGPLAHIDDNWIYVHEPAVEVGRIQIFNNWSPYLVEDPKSHIWVGLEYFCDEQDSVWRRSDEDLLKQAMMELSVLRLANSEDFIEGSVLRMEKSYPSYIGAYRKFNRVRTFLDGYINLYPIGRNGMHRYNNQDHSMLTAMTAVDILLSGQTDKDPIWQVNTEPEYQEEK